MATQARRKPSNDRTRTMLESVTAVEAEHATDMHELPVVHEGRPFIRE